MHTASEVAFFPESDTFLVVNNAQEEQVTEIRGPGGVVATVQVPGGGMVARTL